MSNKFFFLFFAVGIASYSVGASDYPWYTQGRFAPPERIEFQITNPLNRPVTDASVIIKRHNFPLPDLHEMMVTVVDPTGIPRPEPSDSLLRVQGGHQLRAESNGRMLFHQMDDLDKDGIWDEIFFQVDMKANETKTIYIYLGENGRGWNEHGTHANIGSYCRHVVPFWETKEVGWKLWFANSVDAYGKRKPMLVAPLLYGENYDGYGISSVNPDYGSDIQRVANSFGASAMCLFEFPDRPNFVSVPRNTPAKNQIAPRSSFNAGQISDTRYAYDVVVNGPLRSTIKIKTMNWDSGNGFYEYEQFYTAYANHNYCISKVQFTVFQPKKHGVLPGCGMRKKPDEQQFFQQGGIVISGGPEEIIDPNFSEEDDNRSAFVDYVGGAIVVKNRYNPQYRFFEEWSGNHVFCVTPDENNSYEYMVCTAWSEGTKLTNPDDFKKYVEQMAEEFNKPITYKFVKVDKK